jgi:hypothetical protein
LLVGYWQDYAHHSKFGDALIATVEELRTPHREVLFLKDVPSFAYDVGQSATRYAWTGQDLGGLRQSVEQYEHDNRFLTPLLPRLAECGVVILDPLPLLKITPDSEWLQPLDDGGCFYRDQHHLSRYGARRISSIFAPVVDALEPTTPPIAARETLRR